MASYKDTLIKFSKEKLEENSYLKINEEGAKEKNDSLSADENETLSRLEFSDEVKIKLAARVGFKCSYKKCNQYTIGPKGESGDFVILGEAAHIYGATKPKEGKKNRIPRPAPEGISDDYIKSYDNGIWLCPYHHKLVDSIWSEKEHTPYELNKMKREAEEYQTNELKEKEHEVIKKFFDRIPDGLASDYVEIDNFKSSDWLIVLYMSKSSFGEEKTIYNYANWLTSNGIRPKTGGIEMDRCWGEKWAFINYEDRCTNLASIISFSNEDDSFYTGDNFDKLLDDLYNIDENYYNLMIDELKVKY